MQTKVCASPKAVSRHPDLELLDKLSVSRVLKVDKVAISKVFSQFCNFIIEDDKTKGLVFVGRRTLKKIWGQYISFSAFSIVKRYKYICKTLNY